MKRLLVVLTLLAAMGAAVWQFGSGGRAITLANGTAHAVADRSGLYMITLDITADDAPLTLRGARSPAGGLVRIMNPGFAPHIPLVVPAGSTGLLSMEGAHLMYHAPAGALAPGALLPLELEFRDGSRASTQIRVSDSAPMDHGPDNGVVHLPHPQIALASDSAEAETGMRTFRFDLQNFQFYRAEDDKPHQLNQGHGHVYLNGLKLGRIYGPDYALPPVPPGDYQLRVALYSNDHRPYLNAGRPIAMTHDFSTP
jgi:copper(I)-binding protein